MIVTATARRQPVPVLREVAVAHLRITERTPDGHGGREPPQRPPSSPRQHRHAGLARGQPARRHGSGEADRGALPHGFSDGDIWDIAAIAAFFGLSSRMANFAGMANPEFYLMGRMPREKNLNRSNAIE